MPTEREPRSESAPVLARLREHVLRCRRCNAAKASYCAYARPDAELFAALRADEVDAARVVRLAGGIGD